MIVIKQLLFEFWLPFLIALIWTCYNIWDTPGGQWSIRTSVNVFGPTFFFISWLASQWYRVRKQQKVEGGLSNIEASVKRTLAELEAKTVDLVGHITGGESACYIIGTPIASGVLTHTALVHVGKHALYEVSARIVDLEAFDHIKDNLTFENIRNTEILRQFGNLVPNHATMLQEIFSLGVGTSRNFNIFYTARNGSFTQLLRFRKVNDSWLYATKVVRDEATLYENIQEGYPLNENSEVIW